MGSLDDARELLLGAEADLRRILSDAARSGDYASVAKIADWGRSLRRILDDEQQPADSSVPGAKATERNHRPSNPSDRPSIRKRADSAYPRFLRERDQLVRIAWSKAEKQEYEQRTPISVVRTLCVVISQKGVHGRLFTTNDLLPIGNDDGDEVPAYQVYAGLALLKYARLIEQHGRRGYSIANNADLVSEVDTVLHRLEKR